MKHVLFYSILISRLNRSSASKRYITYIALTGAVFAFLQFGEVIARKTLLSGGLSIALLTMTMPVAALTSLWWARLIETRDQRKLLLTMGSVGYLALATGAMLHQFGHMLSIHFVYFLAYALIGPSENRILQRHVASSKTGRTFGLASGIRMGVAAGVSALAGLWLDHKETGFRDIYPVIALIGFFALGLLASIKIESKNNAQPARLSRQFLFSPLKDVVRLLKRRKDFLRYEIAFMLYGIAFMMMMPVIPLYLVDDLELSYGTIGLARGAVTQIIMVIAIPILGRIFDKTTPHRMGAAIFGLLSLFPLMLLSVKFLDGNSRTMMIYLSFAYFGIVMSGVSVVWQLASIRFAGSEDAGVYQSVHVTATGLRGMSAPLLGYLTMSALGKIPAMGISCVIFLLASLMMIVMRRIDYARGENRSLRAG